MPDLYTQILGILYLDLSKEEQALAIKNIVKQEVIQPFQDLLMEYQKECAK